MIHKNLKHVHNMIQKQNFLEALTKKFPNLPAELK